MGCYLKVAEDEGEEPIELPLEEDGTLLLSTLTAQFPGTSGLKFRTESNTFRGVRFAEVKFHPPEDSWGDAIYYCVFLKENKRKSDDNNDSLVAKSKQAYCLKCTDLVDATSNANNPQIIESLRKTVENLFQCVQVLTKEVESQKSITSFIYLGEAAGIVRDYINTLEADSNKIEDFKNFCGLNEQNYRDLKEQTKQYPKARDKICHVHDRNLKLFEKDKLVESYEALHLDKNQIFK